MKNIIICCLLFMINSCYSQKNNHKKDIAMKYYDENLYKDWETDTAYSFSSFEKYLMKGDDRVTIQKGDEAIFIEKSNITNPYIYLYAYYMKSKTLAGSSNFFYSSALQPVGIQRSYNELGKLIEEKNWDKPYKFSIQDLIKKFKKEYNVDIENRKNVKKVERFEFIKALNIPLYMVSLKTDIGNEWLYYLVNGNTGKTLYERKVSEGDEISVIEEYLKSINKFEGKSSKDDPSTSILAEPHENGTYKKPEHGTAYTSQSELSKGKNIYQVYEGRYYTKPEWDEFYKTLSWLERLFIGKS